MWGARKRVSGYVTAENFPSLQLDKGRHLTLKIGKKLPQMVLQFELN